MKRYEKPVKTSRQIQAEETKQKLFMVAQKLISKKGFDGVTIEEISREAGVSKGLFYHYYKSTDDIIIEGYSECDAYFDEYVEQHLKEETAPLRIAEFIDFQMDYAEKKGIDVITQAYKSQIQYGNRFFVSEERALPALLKKIVTEGQEKGEIKTDLSASYITQYILRFSRGMIYDWCLHDGEYNLKEQTREAMLRLLELFVVKKDDLR